MPRRYVIADVFSPTPFGGNQLAVVLDAEGLEPAQMQAVAAEFGFAETTFVLPPERPGSTARVRIFTPYLELPFAGHPTVGTAAVLADAGRMGAEGVLDEGVGPVAVSATPDGASWRAELRFSPRFSAFDAPPRDALSAALGAEVLDVFTGDVGVPFAFCRLADAAAVDAAVPDQAALLAIPGAGEVIGYAGDPAAGEVYARMWGPGVGVPEDAATGSAAAAMVAAVASRPGPDGTCRITITQGVAMGRPSRIEAAAERAGGSLGEVRVGGAVVLVADGALRVP